MGSFKRAITTAYWLVIIGCHVHINKYFYLNLLFSVLIFPSFLISGLYGSPAAVIVGPHVSCILFVKLIKKSCQKYNFLPSILEIRELMTNHVGQNSRNFELVPKNFIRRKILWAEILSDNIFLSCTWFYKYDISLKFKFQITWEHPYLKYSQ